MARLLNLIVVALEIRGLSLSVGERKWMILIFYTQLSNLLATASSVLLVMFGQPGWVSILRYVSTCMLVMTALVTVFVLIPMGGNPHTLLWSGNGLYHHVLCPTISTLSYVLVESHARGWALVLPVAITLVYGLTMLWLNARRLVDGPYPFFRVHNQSKRATVMWVLVLLGVITAISAGVLAIAP